MRKRGLIKFQQINPLPVQTVQSLFHLINRNIKLELIKDPSLSRNELDVIIKRNPELFPQGIQMGYLMKDRRPSKKLQIDTRRIEVDGIAYTVRPSFVMSYDTAFADDVEKGIFLRKFNVPFWALSYVLGKDPMFWYRIEQSLGRNSIVGTTIKNPKLLPEHLSADEKHSRLLGEKRVINFVILTLFTELR